MDAPFDFWIIILLQQTIKNTTRIGEKCKNCRSFFIKIAQSNWLQVAQQGRLRRQSNFCALPLLVPC